MEKFRISVLVERLEKPLGESAQLLRRRLRFFLQPAVLVPQTAHFVLEGESSTRLLVSSRLYARELRHVVWLTTLPNTEITTQFIVNNLSIVLLEETLSRNGNKLFKKVFYSIKTIIFLQIMKFL
jgi:hypothetical protein